jgi:rod shape determining protein RodA
VLGIDRRSVQNFDWALLGLICVLATFGIVNLYSATYTTGGFSDEVRRQLLSLGLGAVAAMAFAAIDYRRFERLALPVFCVAIGLLALTLVLAPVTRGSQSWLFGGRVQPSELAKVALVLALARYFQRYPPGQTTRLRELAWPGAIIGLPVLLIVAQGDMGVALLTLLVGSSYFALVRIPFRAWLAIAVVGVAALAALWSFGLADYQKERILVVVDPGRDPLASGYQVTQSRIAIGSGGILGTGYRETDPPLTFARVQLTGDEGFMETTTTDSLGLFRFESLSEGKYKVTPMPDRDGQGRQLNPIIVLVYSQKSVQEVYLGAGQVLDDMTLYLRTQG